MWSISVGFHSYYLTLIVLIDFGWFLVGLNSFQSNLMVSIELSLIVAYFDSFLLILVDFHWFSTPISMNWRPASNFHKKSLTCSFCKILSFCIGKCFFWQICLQVVVLVWGSLMFYRSPWINIDVHQFPKMLINFRQIFFDLLLISVEFHEPL